MDRRLALIAICFLTSFVGSLAQTSKDYPFHTIGRDYHKKVISEGNSLELTDSLDDEMDESEMADVPTDTLNSLTPMVSLPLKSIEISSLFGMRRDPMNRKKKRMHSGLDLKAKYEEVFSMLPGMVTDAAYSTNGGYYVTVNHGVCVCSYLHLSKIRVKVGQHVNAGDIIAISGNTGKRTTGAHLHISCRMWDGKQKGKFFDPLVILGFVKKQLLDYMSNK